MTEEKWERGKEGGSGKKENAIRERQDLTRKESWGLGGKRYKKKKRTLWGNNLETSAGQGQKAIKGKREGNQRFGGKPNKLN